MGASGVLGRRGTGAEQHPETKAVLGYRFWINQFTGDRSIVGSTLILNGRPRTIVGVMPPRFMFRGADVYLPIAYRDGETPDGVTSGRGTPRTKRRVPCAHPQSDLDPI